MATDKKAVLVRFYPEVHKKLKFVADSNKRTVTNLVEYWIEQNLEKYETENGKIYPLIQQNNNGNGKQINNNTIMK